MDVIDPAEMPAKDSSRPAPGLTLAEVSDLLTALVASPRVVALEVAEYDPARDPDGRARRARSSPCSSAPPTAVSRAEPRAGPRPRLPPVGARRILAASFQEEMCCVKRSP